jgi:hypothetical protein
MFQVCDLFWVTVSVPPSKIEDVLASVEQLPASVNCEIAYRDGLMEVGFPAWRQWLAGLEALFPCTYRHALPSCK